MPYFLDTSTTRRRFLSIAGLSAAGLAVSRQVGALSGDQGRLGEASLPVQRSDGPLRLALLSDTHIPANAAEAYRGFTPVDNLRHVAAQVSKADVQATIIGGDLARLIGTAEDYGRLQALLAPISEKMPVGLILGNHDNRANFLATFPSSAGTSQGVRNKHVMVLEEQQLRFILLDSLLAPDVTPGQLGLAQRTWLAQYLASAKAVPTMVFVHHTLDDNDGALMDVERLFGVIRPHAHVKAILYGHSHRYRVDERDGIQLINLPAVGYNFADTEPVGWVESVWTADGVDLTLRTIGGHQAANGQTTSVHWAR